MKNEYKIIDDYVILYLKKRDGRIFETYIDLEDFDKIEKLDLSWNAAYDKKLDDYYAKSSKYLGIVDGKFKYKTHYLHKHVMNANKGEVVDHLNHNTLDNRKENLYIVNPHKNDLNRKGANKNSTSGYRNVHWNNREEKWFVQLQVNGKNTCFAKFNYDELDKANKLAEELREKIYNKIYNIEEIKELKLKYKN